ncbi:MAG: ribosome silencing factor [Alphaproteobacteria bacterium]|nr:ribosome silencing factor [Alphaproteobacteria bacterium]
MVKKPATAKRKAKPAAGRSTRPAAKKSTVRKPAGGGKPPAAGTAAAKPADAGNSVRKKAPKQAAPAKARAAKAREAGAVERQLALVQEILADNKAEDVVVLDVVGRTSIADYLVIACGRSQRQVGAIADHLLRGLQTAGQGRHLRVEGMPQNDWVLIDTGDIIIHLFRPEVRDFYRLEHMWAPELDESAGSGGT